MKRLYSILLVPASINSSFPKGNLIGTYINTNTETNIGDLILLDVNNVSFSTTCFPKHMCIVTLELLDIINNSMVRGIPISDNIFNIPINILDDNIIASTIYVSQKIPKSFIQDFIIRYNKNNVSRYVIVETNSYIKADTIITSPILNNNDEIDISFLNF